MTGLLPLLQGSLERAPWGWALFGVVLLTLIKMWPALSLQAQQARDRLRAEGRADLASCQEQCAELRTDMAQLHDKFHELELKLVGAIQGYRILEAEVVASNPTSIALTHARAAMSAAFTISSSEMPESKQ